MLVGSSAVFAQSESAKKRSPIDVSCDLMSRYVWRGMDLGASPSIQPGISYSKAGFTVGAWGAYTTNLVALQEADLYLSYTYKEKFSLTFTDYFFPDETGSDYKYFNYKEKSTGHIFEMSARTVDRKAFL